MSEPLYPPNATPQQRRRLDRAALQTMEVRRAKEKSLAPASPTPQKTSKTQRGPRSGG